jgi:hypothetical protein
LAIWTLSVLEWRLQIATRQSSNSRRQANAFTVVGGLCVFFGTVLLALFFVYFGRFDLARPSLISVAMVALVIVMRWTLRRHVWFWITITILAALHVPLILFVPWTTKWIPAIVIAPIGIADLYAMLWVLSVVGKFVEGPKSAIGSKGEGPTALL